MSATLAHEAELWRTWREGGDLRARDALLAHYAAWAGTIARSVHRKVWAYPVDQDDFAQNAMIGLLEAMTRFDPARGVPFQAFARPRVRGAVFNGLRAILGDRPRPVDEARHARRLETIAEGEGGDAFDAVVEAVLGLGLGFLLDDAAGSDRARDGLAYAHSVQMRERLEVAVDALPERLRSLIRAHYFHHVPFVEMAERSGLTKGRISQLHRAALDRLRDALRD